MEDGVYICQWKQVGGLFRLWVKSDPSIYVEGEDEVLVLSEELSEVITSAGGAMHAVLEFDPPLPKAVSDDRYASPELLTVSSGGPSFHVVCPNQNDLAWFDPYFERPHCRDCHSYTAPRNDRPFTLSHVEPGYDAGFVGIRGTMWHVFSAAFLDLLMPEERARMTMLPLNRPKGSRKKYLELIGPDGPPSVAVADLDATGWRCDRCGARTFGYWTHSRFRRFVAHADLPNPLPSVFVVGTRPKVQLCVTAGRWKSLVGRPGTRGLVTSPLGVARPEDINEKLQLPTKREQGRSNTVQVRPTGNG